MFSKISVSKDTVVRLLTIVITPVAAALTAWGAKQGLDLPASSFVTVGALAGAAVLGLGFHWLQKQPVILKAESDLSALADKISAGVKTDPALADAISALAAKIDSQKSDILSELAKAGHVSSPVETLLQQLLDAGKASSSTPITPAPVASVYDQAAAPPPSVSTSA